jgi:3-hydroxybutyryl-CoA dehydrogenase
MAAGSIGIIGAGTMGSGIAQVAAMAGHEVLLYDTRPEALNAARDQLNSVLNRLVEKGKLTDQAAKAVFGRIYLLESLNGLRDAMLVIEAVVEDILVKKNLFKTLEDIADPETILASNTSSLSISSIAGFCKNPQRVVGIHFFNPAPLMQLVEIIPALQTASDVVVRTETLLNAWGKTTVRAGDTPGFIVNRIARPYYSEAIKIYEERLLHHISEGVAGFKVIDDAMTDAGFRMGPFALMDFIGNDVNYAVTRSVWEACYYEPRYMPSQLQRQLVEAGWLGKKSGRGYYQYNNEETSSGGIYTDVKKQIQERIITMLKHEAADAVFKGIASPADIDLAMTKGANYPIELLREVDMSGADSVVNTMDRLFDEYHDPRYRCSALLRKYARENKKFYS